MNRIIFLLLKLENGSHRPEHHTRVNHPSIKTLYQGPDCGDSRAADASVSQQLSPSYTGDALRQGMQSSWCSFIRALRFVIIIIVIIAVISSALLYSIT